MSRKEIYHSYLESEEWQLLRQLAILRNKKKNNDSLTCVDCGMTHKKIYDVHHEQYPKSGDYWSDDSSDFHVVLCRECHETRHNKNKDDMMPVERERRNNDFLCLYGAFIVCFPSYRDLYTKHVEGIDLGDYKLLFNFIDSCNILGEDIYYLLSCIENSDMDNEIKFNFNIHIDYFTELKSQAKKINYDIVALTLKEIPTDCMELLVHESKQKTLKKQSEDIENTISNSFDIILKTIGKHKRKLKRGL